MSICDPALRNTLFVPGNCPACSSTLDAPLAQTHAWRPGASGISLQALRERVARRESAAGGGAAPSLKLTTFQKTFDFCNLKLPGCSVARSGRPLRWLVPAVGHHPRRSASKNPCSTSTCPRRGPPQRRRAPSPKPPCSPTSPAGA